MAFAHVESGLHKLQCSGSEESRAFSKILLAMNVIDKQKEKEISSSCCRRVFSRSSWSTPSKRKHGVDLFG